MAQYADPTRCARTLPAQPVSAERKGKENTTDLEARKRVIPKLRAIKPLAHTNTNTNNMQHIPLD